MAELVERSIWRAMKARCHNPKSKKYQVYGARGIIVCDLWRTSFDAFYKDMGARPGSKYSIERINNNGNYEPGNCQWVTMKSQQNNRRNNVSITIEGKTQTLSQWCEEFDMPYKTIWNRIKVIGMNPLESLTKPINGTITHCKYGHELSGSNIYIRLKTGERICRNCAKQRILNFKQRKLQNG